MDKYETFSGIQKKKKQVRVCFFYNVKVQLAFVDIPELAFNSADY